MLKFNGLCENEGRDNLIQSLNASPAQELSITLSNGCPSL